MPDKDNYPIVPINSSLGSSKNISNNEISHNDVNGDLIIGSTVVNIPTYDISVGAEALRTLIEKHEQLKEDSPEYLYVIEELQSKIREVESRQVVGLEAKLCAAERMIYLNQAIMSSQKASKMISKFQHVKSYQIIFNHILSLILTRFNSHILPLIREGGNDLAINSAINNTIIGPLYREVSLAGGYITTDLVEGMLYFLTEKCHVEWK